MTKKQKTNLILLCIVLIVVVAGYFLLRHRNEETAKDSYTAFSVAAEDIQEIAVTNASGAFDIVRVGDVFVPAADESQTLDSGAVDSMLEDLTEITANKAIADVTDYTQYSLDEPSTAITVTLTDGTVKTISIGAYSGSASRYYLRIDEETTVYLVGTQYHADFETTEEDLIVEVEESEETDTTEIEG